VRVHARNSSKEKGQLPLSTGERGRYGVRMEKLLVASSASATGNRGKPRRSIGLRHAYRDASEQTLCGLMVRYLYVIENDTWRAKTPQRCTTCADAATAIQASS
jgi:hypothetical protein